MSSNDHDDRGGDLRRKIQDERDVLSRAARTGFEVSPQMALDAMDRILLAVWHEVWQGAGQGARETRRADDWPAVAREMARQARGWRGRLERANSSGVADIERTRRLLGAALRNEARARRRNDDLVAVLREIEWRCISGQLLCSYCWGRVEDGHYPGCKLAAALKEEK